MSATYKDFKGATEEDFQGKIERLKDMRTQKTKVRRRKIARRGRGDSRRERARTL